MREEDLISIKHGMNMKVNEWCISQKELAMNNICTFLNPTKVIGIQPSTISSAVGVSHYFISLYRQKWRKAWCIFYLVWVRIIDLIEGEHGHLPLYVIC
jgi:ABC-type long-subunit fatty acid transport system fused permease/ATPase subunit